MTSFTGGTGNDTFDGGAGNDSASGNDGFDTLNGGGGADTLDGGAGYDILYSGAPLGAYRLPYYGNPYETPVLDRANDVDTLTGGEGDDILSAGYGDNVDGGDGSDILFVSFQGAASGVTFDLNAASQTIGGGTIQNIESAAWIEGSEHNDTITDLLYDPLSTINTIFGMGGDDSIVGGATTGNIFGGDGNDAIDVRNSTNAPFSLGGAGNDTIYAVVNAFGDEGDDVLYVTDGGYGGAGNDTFIISHADFGGVFYHGGDGNDSIDNSAGAGGGWLAGEAGDDVVRGGAENDFLWGGAGNDTLNGGSDWGEDPYFGPFGDMATYSGRSTDYHLTVDADSHLVMIVDLRNGSPDGTDTLDSVETLQFSDGNFLLADLLSATEVVPDDFVGDSSNDYYAGNLRNNTAVGNDGDDNLGGEAGNDTLEGDAGADALDGGAGNDEIYSTIVLGYYQPPANVEDEGYIAPQLDRGTEVDTLNGGAGDDLMSAGYGDNVDGGGGRNTLFISFQGATSGVTFDLTQTSQTVGGATIANIESAGWIEGSEFDDTIIDGRGSVYGSYEPIFGMGGNDSLVAGNFTSSLSGGDGNDVLDGRYSQYVSFLSGGVGDDTIYGRDGSEEIDGGDGNDLIYGYGQLRAGAGNDTVLMAFSEYGGNVLGGDGNDDLTTSEAAQPLYGNGGNDVLRGLEGYDWLYGGTGDDTLSGGMGNDSMAGGAGNDSYLVDAAGDMIIEAAGEGVDTVNAWIDLTLADNVENLILQGAAALDSTGNALNNALTGNVGNNHLYGYAGNDLLDGAAGADTMTGGIGADTYIVDEIGDVVIELAGQGTDTVKSSVRYTLGDNVERLTLTGTLNIAGTGNALDNIVIGNDGNNRLDGGAGADTMSGGLGDDFYTIDNAGDVIREQAGQGIDSIITGLSYGLGGQYIENVQLTGTADVNATGNALANTLIGNAGHNVLNGLSGIDKMFGGAGNDTYYVDNAGDRTYEVNRDLSDSGGHDVVNAGVQTTLEKNIEDLVITGTFNLGGTGNALDNHITGNSGNNVLAGRDGNDVLDGATGADRMVGGLGDDSYYIDNVGDRVIENIGQGNDTVYSSISFYLGRQYLETLVLTGTADINATGNNSANTLIGNDGNNLLEGGFGNDTLTGGKGADAFVFHFRSGTDIITDFNSAEGDTIRLSGLAHGVMVTVDGADILLDFSGGDMVRLVAPVNWNHDSIIWG